MSDRRAELIRFLEAGRAQLRDRAKAEMMQRGYRDEKTGEWRGGLYAFVKYFWSLLEPGRTFMDGWPVEAICEHLEAVTFGEIRRLLINVPPGFMKSLLTDVFWPAWEWGPMKMAHLRYVAFSYSSSLTERDNGKFRDIIRSREYQTMFGEWVKLTKTGETKVANNRYGWKLATSIEGVGTGERGDRVILDDPHKVKEAESDHVREGVIDFFRESMSNRLNDMEKDAIIIIMQRVHEADVSGTILELGLDYCHLMIPMEYDPARQTDAEGQPLQNDIGWYDPRWEENLDEAEGVLAWSERFSPKTNAQTLKEIGPHAWAGQYQQAPKARGTAIISREMWQLWDPPDGKFPVFDYLVASLDGAFTTKEQNDPSALTIWGVFHNESKQRRIMLVHAWRKRLKFKGPNIPRKPMEHTSSYRLRAMKQWGLIEHVEDSCNRFNVDRLLIENKANGKPVAEELLIRNIRQGWAIELVEPVGDKVARCLAVQPTFAQGMVYAPERDWSEMVIAEIEVFPKGRYKDLTDSSTQAIKHLRTIGLAQTDEEAGEDERERVSHQSKKRKPLYPGMRA